MESNKTITHTYFGWLFWLAVVLAVSAATFWVFYIGYQENILHAQFNTSDEHITSIKRALYYKQLSCGSTSYSSDRLLKKVNNNQEPLKETYIPDSLTTIPYQYVHPRVGNLMVREEVIEPLVDMMSDAQTEGLNLRINSAYRSYEQQQEVYKNSAEEVFVNEVERAARPGYSEHQLGSAVDISLYPNNGQRGYDWLADNAYRYGFVLSYPNGAQEVTEYLYEPWHWRYVGQDIAQHIHNNNMLYNHERTMLLPSPVVEKEDLPYEYNGRDIWVWKYLPPRKTMETLIVGDTQPAFYNDIFSIMQMFNEGILPAGLDSSGLSRRWIIETSTRTFTDEYGRKWLRTSLASPQDESVIERVEVLRHQDLGYMVISYQTQEAGDRLAREFTTSCGVN